MNFIHINWCENVVLAFNQAKFEKSPENSQIFRNSLKKKHNF